MLPVVEVGIWAKYDPIMESGICIINYWCYQDLISVYINFTDMKYSVWIGKYRLKKLKKLN